MVTVEYSQWEVNRFCCQMVLTNSMTLGVIYPLKALFSSSLKWAVGRIKWRNLSKAFGKVPDTASITLLISLIISLIMRDCHDWGIRLLATFDHKLPPYLKLEINIHETPIFLSFFCENSVPLLLKEVLWYSSILNVSSKRPTSHKYGQNRKIKLNP